MSVSKDRLWCATPNSDLCNCLCNLELIMSSSIVLCFVSFGQSLQMSANTSPIICCTEKTKMFHMVLIGLLLEEVSLWKIRCSITWRHPSFRKAALLTQARAKQSCYDVYIKLILIVQLCACIWNMQTVCLAFHFTLEEMSLVGSLMFQKLYLQSFWNWYVLSFGFNPQCDSHE